MFFGVFKRRYNLFLILCWFFRISEILSVKRSDVVFLDTHCDIKVEKSKTDILREGNTVLIAKTNTDTCPVKLFEKYLCVADIACSSTDYVFRPVYLCNVKHCFKLISNNKHISYSTINDSFKKKLSLLGYVSSKYGLHSFRAGGASISANNKTVDRLWHGRHGR